MTLPAALRVCEKSPWRSSNVGTVVMDGCAVAIAVFFPVHEEERLVLLDRASERGAELILDQVRPLVTRAVLEEVIRVQNLISRNS